MKKEIKFRVWDKHCKYFINFGEKYWFDDDENTITFQCDSVMGDHDDGDRFIFQQFTGLLDKNGKEIWEGDIVFDNVGGYKAKVEWGRQNNQSCWILVNGVNVENISRWANGTLMERIDLEVIGNVYENPDLLTRGSLSE